MSRSWMRPVFATLLGATLLATLPGCGSAGALAPRPSSPDGVELVRRGPGGQTRFMARNVLYRLDKDVSMYLADMNADILMKDPSQPFVPANKGDYAIAIHRATVTKKAEALGALMNNYVFNEPDSPLKEIRIQFKGDRIVMSGKMKKGIWVGFEMEGVLDTTSDGLLKMTPKVIKSMGMRVDGLMSLIGLEMAKLMKMKEEKGLILNGNEIIMDPSKLYPPPTLVGKVSSVAIRDGLLHLQFDDGRGQPWPETPVKNTRSTLLMWGGDVLINRCLNLNAKFQILDATPETPMVFALDFYREQLEAGFVTPTKAGEMIAYVPDVNTYTPEMGRYTPPAFPVPGIRDWPSDMDAGAREAEDGGPAVPTSVRKR